MRRRTNYDMNFMPQFLGIHFLKNLRRSPLLNMCQLISLIQSLFLNIHLVRLMWIHLYDSSLISTPSSFGFGRGGRSGYCGSCGGRGLNRYVMGYSAFSCTCASGFYGIFSFSKMSMLTHMLLMIFQLSA